MTQAAQLLHVAIDLLEYVAGRLWAARLYGSPGPRGKLRPQRIILPWL